MARRNTTIDFIMPKLTLCFKGRFISLHNLSTGCATIGRAPECEIHIDSLAIADRHARIDLLAKGCQVTPLPDATVYVNQRKIDQPALLAHGDCLRIGKHELFYSDCITDLNQDIRQEKRSNGTNGRPRQSRRDPFDRLLNNLSILPTGSVQILSGRHVGKIIPLQRGLTRLGLNGNECAVIAHRNDGYYLSHLEGDIPPKVNSRSIGDHSVRLKEGHEIQLGGIRMRFHEAIEQSAAM
ncbi:MAG: FHA domain-containing protein [Sedimenticola sp.]|nr:FHA domain-containing protein [Sedimenticola sp.]